MIARNFQEEMAIINSLAESVSIEKNKILENFLNMHSLEVNRENMYMAEICLNPEKEYQTVGVPYSVLISFRHLMPIERLINILERFYPHILLCISDKEECEQYIHKIILGDNILEKMRFFWHELVPKDLHEMLTDALLVKNRPYIIDSDPESESDLELD